MGAFSYLFLERLAKLVNEKELQTACEKAVDFLKKYGDPYCQIIIRSDEIRLTRDEIGIPVK